MDRSAFSSVLLMLLFVALCGCNTYNPQYHGGQNAVAYSSSRPVQRVAPVAPSPQPQPRQIVVEPKPTFTDPAATSRKFDEDVKKKTQQGREERINAFLRKNDLWGGSVIETRDKFKVAIASADLKLADLRRDIVLNGGAVATDPRYIAAESARNNLAKKLKALDDRIMNAIVNKSVGEVARQLIYSEEDKAAADAASENLNQAGKNYEKQSNEMLQRANW